MFPILQFTDRKLGDVNPIMALCALGLALVLSQHLPPACLNIRFSAGCRTSWTRTPEILIYPVYAFAQ